MARTNGKSEVDPQELDAAHELPASDDAQDEAETIESASSRSSDSGSELQKLRVERDTLIDRLARLQAEFENARKRTAREQQDFREYAVADAVKALLPTLDSFERALQTSAADKSEFRGGVELIYKQLQDALQKLGLRAISAKGEPFDPHLHEAIEMVETTDADDHQILEELQRGYKLKDRLLRPSMVKVARNPKH
ncbi:MAG TPA: nucleotide exchange factor GrpE [Terriglobales bacterium]|jgi:molecular chaperone GrpE|nr:nucleotide exchange factor GrpE [Terriglobales bacterium]